MEDAHLTMYKYQCYDDLSHRVRDITDQLQLFNYYDLDNDLYDLVQDGLILKTMNTYTKYVIDCTTFREVTLLYNIVLDQIIPVSYELSLYYSKLKEKKKQYVSFE